MKFVGVLLAVSLAVPGAWTKPVDGPVVRTFSPPASRYGAGHQGVDFSASPGRPVRAAGAGTVSFAGLVAGTMHVVVAHDGDLRTSYSFLASASVRRGERVDRGDVVGTSGGTGRNHNGSVVHLGLRQGDTYLDPMLLFAEIDLAEVVHLAPVDEPLFRTAADERRSLLESVGGLVGDAVSSVAGAGRAAFEAVADMLQPLVDHWRNAGRDALAHIREVMELNPWVRRAALAFALARSTLRYVQELFECDSNAPAADGTGGSGHRVMLVGGIQSQLDRGGVPFGVDPAQLGYAPGEVTAFTYSGRATYEPDDTLAPIIDSAHALSEQLKAMQRADPGREVDLVAHSQGGVVVLAFLELIYEPGNPDYPPLGTVVTFGAPLDGAPLATAASEMRAGPGLGPLLVELADATGLAPPSDAPATTDLAAGSDLMDRLGDADRPGTIDLTTIGGSYDIVVPGSAAGTDGATHTIVTPDVPAWDVHTELPSDADALRAARSALEAKDALPCRDLATFIEGELIAPYIEEMTLALPEATQALSHPWPHIPGP